MVRTDGYGLDFLVAQTVSQTSDLPDLDLTDFTEDELNTKFKLWGADPGQKTIFTASDGHDNNPHQVRKYSTAEYYTRAGFTRTNKRLEQWKQQDELYLRAERNLLSSKTANIVTFNLYIASVLNNLDHLLRHNNDLFTSTRFLNYIGKKRADAEMANIFISGGKKYLKKRFKQDGRDNSKSPKKRRKRRRKTPIGTEQPKPEKTRKKRPLPFQQDDRIPLVALGDAVFPSTMKGTIPGVAKRLVKVLKKAEHEGLLVTVPVPEYLTSKVSNNSLNIALLYND